MKRITAVSGAGIAAVALTLTLAGCGSSTKTEEKTTATTSAQATSAAPSSAEPTSAAPPTSGDPQAAGGETLDALELLDRALVPAGVDVLLGLRIQFFSAAAGELVATRRAARELQGCGDRADNGTTLPEGEGHRKSRRRESGRL